MGANSKQGWCLFTFLIGFTFLPAGLVYLGPLFSLVGLACLIGSAIGFYRIKPLEHGGCGQSPVAVPVAERHETTRPISGMNLKGGQV